MISEWKENEIVSILKKNGFYLYTDHPVAEEAGVGIGNDHYVRFNLDGSEDLVRAETKDNIMVIKSISAPGTGRYTNLLSKVTEND
jgi:hypothetical protein